jgi:hypothetical protein
VIVEPLPVVIASADDLTHDRELDRAGDERLLELRRDDVPAVRGDALRLIAELFRDVAVAEDLRRLLVDDPRADHVDERRAVLGVAVLAAILGRLDLRADAVERRLEVGDGAKRGDARVEVRNDSSRRDSSFVSSDVKSPPRVSTASTRARMPSISRARS